METKELNREEAIKHELCPRWLKDAEWEGRVILSDSIPFVTLKNGTWKYGFWKGGTWEDGIWKDGIWEDGIWKNGTWKYGFWKDGIWEGGIWKDGIWKDGTWEGGTWEDGFKRVGQCFWRYYYNPRTQEIKLGCKTKTVKDWIEWFKSDETYDHKRNSEEFKKIYQAFLIAKYAIETERGEL